jgi:hypothetical protein
MVSGALSQQHLFIIIIIIIKPDEDSFHLIKVINWSLVFQNAHLFSYWGKE